MTGLRTMRRRAGLSQAELGARVGVSSQAVSQWERGDSLPALEKLWALSRAVNCTPVQLLAALTADEDNYTQEEDEIP